MGINVKYLYDSKKDYEFRIFQYQFIFE